MDWLIDADWEKMFYLDTPLLEIFLRGSLVYLSLFILLRLILKRQAGTVGITDLLVIVLIADAAQNAMAGGYHSVPAGILLVATLIFWNFAIEWLGFRIPHIGKWVHPPPLPLVKEGRMLHKNMQRELITREELISQLREQGVDDIHRVKSACLEGDGQVSVIQYPVKQRKKRKRQGL
jgi:uncharacterized membrane protein YcaP (DUF421 family)